MQIHSFEPQLTLNFPHQKLYYIKGNVYSMAVTDKVKKDSTDFEVSRKDWIID